ncbi:MAG: Bcr/CflA family drug resistance efflux transporter [Alphaproteobacteria bacterium CG11_big_fil_rev_8_21_14_0_20_44_7]|nr:MAG: Bcr/CflA family drug resistance efflux transporter [Alphaproteobacteria bacterium CG11_big_fil_rev_8_21_14_0_20_44_7]
MNNQNKTASDKEFIVLMALLMSVVAISIDAMLPALGVIGKALEVSHPNQAQYIISSVFIGLAIGQLISGPLSDAVGRKKALFLALSLYLLGSVICFLSGNIELMLFGRFVQGLGASGPYVACMSIVRDKYSGRHMARVMSLVMMIFITVPIIAPALGQGILLLASWRYIFALYILYSSLVMVWVAFRLEETLPEENRIAFNLSNITSGIKTVFSNRQTVCYTICMGLIFGALIGDLNSAQQIFQGQFGVGKMFVVYFGLQALAFGVSSLVNSQLVEKFGMRYLSVRAIAIMTILSALFLLAHYFVDIQFWMFFLYGMALLFCFGILFGNLNALALEPMGDIAGLASAIIGSSSSVIAIISGTIIGQMYDGTLIPIVSGFLILGMLSWGVMFFFDKEAKQSS